MITEEQIKQGIDQAYKEAGHNAYFADGFRAGVKFALNQIQSENTEPKEVNDDENWEVIAVMPYAKLWKHRITGQELWD